MASITKDIETASVWIAKALASSGYVADFSPQSLWHIDFFFDDHSRDGTPVARGLLSKKLGPRLFALGAYVGEVVRRSAGGSWIGDDHDQEAEIKVVLRLPDGTECWPIQRVMKRFKNGSEEGIVAYAAALGVEVGPKPERAPLRQRRPWWRFW